MAFEGLREALSCLRQAHAEGDSERVWGLLDDLEDDLDAAEVGRAHDHLPVDHCCAVCETTCDEVTAFRRSVRELQGQVLLLSYALAEAHDLRDMARQEIDARFPEERAA